MNVTMLPVVRSFPAQPSALPGIREFVRSQASSAGLPDETVDDLSLAVTELCGNAIEHSGTERVFVSYSQEDDAVQIRVRDEGLFHQRLFASGSPGLGLALVLALADAVSIKRGTRERPGTVVRVVKGAPTAKSQPVAEEVLRAAV